MTIKKWQTLYKEKKLRELILRLDKDLCFAVKNFCGKNFLRIVITEISGRNVFFAV